MRRSGSDLHFHIGRLHFRFYHATQIRRRGLHIFWVGA